jgi:hypothetical protein
VSFAEYEAEDGITDGTILGPSRTFGEVAAEASGRRAVRLDATGESVRITPQYPANSIVVRYSIPDSADGQGFWSTLGVYVDGELRARLNVTSRYAWTYGAFGNSRPNDPAQGTPHHFFDESHALIGDVPAGATVMLRKDAEDSAAHYDIDLVDLEQVGPPLTRPNGYISVTDCGATPNDDSDDSAAIQHCVDEARGQNRGLFIPQGSFRSLAAPISVAGITIRGAGMWYSTVYGYNARFDCWGNDCKYYDFGVFGDTVVRDDASAETNFGGNGSSGVLLENIWMEHSKTGYWTGANTDGLIIRGSRIRNLYADGVNLFKGTKNSVVENTHLRNTGDDALAAWSPADGAANSNNVFRHDFVQLPWMANCFGLYGGADSRIEDSVCADVVQYPGILLARQFDSQPFTGMIQVSRTSLIRAGGRAYGEAQGALKLHADQGPLQHVQISDVDIVEPTYSGIQFQGNSSMDSVWFDGVRIQRAGTVGIHVVSSANGACDLSNVVVTDAASGGLRDDAGGKLTLIRGAGNAGW